MKPRFIFGRDDRSVGGAGRSTGPSLWLALPLAVILAGAALFGVNSAADSMATNRAAAAVASDLHALVVATHDANTAQTGPTPGSELAAGLSIVQLEPAVTALAELGSGSSVNAMIAAFQQLKTDVAAGEQAIVTGQTDAALVNTTVGTSNQTVIDAIGAASAGFQQSADSAGTRFTVLAGGLAVLIALIAAGAFVLVAVQRGAINRMRRHLDEHFRAMTKYSSDVISLVDQNGKVAAQSSSLLRLLGRSDLGMIGRPFADIVHESDRPRLAELTRSSLNRPGEPATGRINLLHSDGTTRVVDVTATHPIDHPELDGVLLTCRSTQERSIVPAATIANGNQLQHPVSGLLSEPLFRDRLAHALNRSARSASPVALLVIELGGEQTFAGLSEDAQVSVLRAISGRLGRAIRGGDSIAHLSGFAFAVILEETSLEAARVISRRVYEQLSPPVAHMNGRIRLTPRIGIAIKTDPRDTVDTLLLDARTALSGKDAAGSNDPAVAPAHDHAIKPANQAANATSASDAPEPADSSAATGTAATQETPKALLASFLTDSPAARLGSSAAKLDGTDAFVMQFLPVLALESGEVVELEATARWRHPKRGLVPVEHSGRMDVATAWMLAGACRVAPMLPVTPAGHQVRISVNISPLTPLDDVLIDTVAKTLLSSGLKPSSLQLEIAARSLDTDGSGQAQKMLRQLRELGVRLVLDGVGTDASRLPDFERLPVHGIKLDRSVVTLLDRSPDRRSLVRELIELAREHGMSVTGVGVESLEQAERLWDLGADAGQGPLFFRPISEEQLPALFATEPASVAAD
jgi:PAS domain S-box-containing protein